MGPSNRAWVADYERDELKHWRSMMTTISVQYVNPPQPGKKLGTVKDAGGNTFYFDPTALKLEAGKSYTVETRANDFKGRTYVNIQSAKETKAPADFSGAAPWFMPFVSNTVAHAVSAGYITEPLHVKTWALAAKRAAETLVEDEEEPDFETTGGPEEPPM